jgi:hypothetical protein
MLADVVSQVDGLTLTNENYKPWKGVRSITQNGKFICRC